MEFMFSVVIPSFNRIDQLRLTLTSFNRQTFSSGRFEVIVVDDGSTDGTKEMVTAFKANYPLVYISSAETTGRSTARNLGISASRGHYIIFCDADFIVTSKYIETFYKYHKKYRKTVISAFPNSWGGIYAQYYPQFSRKQKARMKQQLNRHGLWKKAWEKEQDGIVQIVKPEDLYKKRERIKKLIFLARMRKEAKKAFKNTKYAPWLLFVTRSVSIKKGYLKKVGGFDENFVKYGLEDWELGYRLNRMGLRFVSIDKVIGYHQVHPKRLGEGDGNKDNLRYIYKKHGFSDPELTLFSVVRPSFRITKYKKKLMLLDKYRKNKRLIVVRRLKTKWRKIAESFYRKGG